MAYASCMHHRCPDIVYELLLDELLAIPDAVKYLADGKRRGRVLAQQAKRGLIVRGNGIFQPEQPVRLQISTQPSGLDGRQAVMTVVQQIDVPAERRARGFE